jgi:hypothetical protein
MWDAPRLHLQVTRAATISPTLPAEFAGWSAPRKNRHLLTSLALVFEHTFLSGGKPGDPCWRILGRRAPGRVQAYWCNIKARCQRQIPFKHSALRSHGAAAWLASKLMLTCSMIANSCLMRFAKR